MNIPQIAFILFYIQLLNPLQISKTMQSNQQREVANAIQNYNEEVVRLKSELKAHCGESYGYPSQFTTLPQGTICHLKYRLEINEYYSRQASLEASIAALCSSLNVIETPTPTTTAPTFANMQKVEFSRVKKIQLAQLERSLDETRKLLVTEKQAYYRMIDQLKPINAAVYYRKKEELESKLTNALEALRIAQINEQDALGELPPVQTDFLTDI